MVNDSPLTNHFAKSDGLMLAICYGLTVYSLGLAFWYNTWLEAIVIGVGSAVALTALYAIAKGTAVCRIAMGAGFMIYTALHIHQAHGMIEFHFGVFALLAMLLFYRDWLPIVAAAATIAVHHFLFFYLQISGADVWVLRTTDSGFLIILLHAGYVVVETALLILMAVKLNSEARQTLELIRVTDAILASGAIDLSQRTSGATEVLKRFDRYTGDVGSLVNLVRDSAGQINSDGNNLATITDEISEHTQVQQRETELVAGAVEELSAAIADVTSNAEQTAQSSSQVDENAQQATAVCHATQAAVERLAEEIRQAAGSIGTLNHQATQIGSVLDVIRGIAEQTNLLALNAAIEAARAGEQGRGFAVVADEVRALAQRTQQSTEEINQMIKQLQSGSQSAVQVIEQSQSQAENCVLNTQNTLHLIEQVSGAMQNINQMNTLIATAASQQRSVIGEVSRNLSNMLDASNRTSEDSQNAASCAASLKQVAEQLSAILQRFTVAA
ncbi:methyl-accepting chemotaxis protein [Halioxenophilus sp. WMMB6]|uniref:methyl-accepting chemotaxis protein n=1 Tax=Halioxenophilus sp. WMMB6 TaxID=3073815 RepID=UPI00295ECFA1|nr:methyl-accepting chemotaxis protein [Halioxenophilus sp. WMMB6]